MAKKAMETRKDTRRSATISAPAAEAAAPGTQTTPARAASPPPRRVAHAPRPKRQNRRTHIRQRLKPMSDPAELLKTLTSDPAPIRWRRVIALLGPLRRGVAAMVGLTVSGVLIGWSHRSRWAC